MGKVVSIRKVEAVLPPSKRTRAQLLESYRTVNALWKDTRLRCDELLVEIDRLKARIGVLNAQAVRDFNALEREYSAKLDKREAEMVRSVEQHQQLYWQRVEQLNEESQRDFQTIKRLEDELGAIPLWVRAFFVGKGGFGGR